MSKKEMTAAAAAAINNPAAAAVLAELGIEVSTSSEPLTLVEKLRQEAETKFEAEKAKKAEESKWDDVLNIILAKYEKEDEMVEYYDNVWYESRTQWAYAEGEKVKQDLNFPSKATKADVGEELVKRYAALPLELKFSKDGQKQLTMEQVSAENTVFANYALLDSDLKRAGQRDKKLKMRAAADKITRDIAFWEENGDAIVADLEKRKAADIAAFEAKKAAAIAAAAAAKKAADAAAAAQAAAPVTPNNGKNGGRRHAH